MSDINKLFINVLCSAMLNLFTPLFVCLLLFCGSGAAQTTQISRTSDGLTTAGLAPGAPAGAYPLSEFENINLFNGQVSFTLPLVQKGRGGANISLPIKINRPSWLVQHELQPYPTLQGVFIHTLSPYPDWWNDTYTHPILPGGRMYGRYVNTEIEDCTSSGNGVIYKRTNTFLTFITPDGTEYKFIDKYQGGNPRSSGCSNFGNNYRGTIW